jgi:predicted RNase H-like nuclease (RuvC/YqgF family)
MSDNISQHDLYKDKCLYVTLNVLLSKIQRLERRVATLEARNTDIHVMYNKRLKPSDNITQLKNHINRLELKMNEQNKIINHYIENKELANEVLTADLDNYLKDIDEIMEFQITNSNDLEKLK